jgi:SAM-dependent methyltransferase
MVWKKDAPQGHEVSKIRWELVPYTRGRGLDLGCGPEKGFPHFRGIDSNKDAALFGIQATAADFIIPTCEVLDDFASASQDFIFSSHLLEHIVEHEKALREWWRVLRPGGHLCLYLPHKDFYPNIGTDGANPDHKHDFHPDDIIAAMKKIGGWDLVENQDRNEGDEYSFFQVYKKYADAKSHRFSYREPKPAKTCAIVRYGAWGDVIQMTSVLPALKEEGYHVTLYTVPRAWEAVKHEPLIDA